MSKLYADNRVIAMTRRELLKELSTVPLTLEPLNDGLWVNSCECEYCNSVVDTTYINCPNCGAPLKKNYAVPMRRFMWRGFPVEIVEDDI